MSCVVCESYGVHDSSWERFKCFNVNFISLNEYMCICWCINYINYRMHGATIKILIYRFFSIENYKPKICLGNTKNIPLCHVNLNSRTIQRVFNWVS